MLGWMMVVGFVFFFGNFGEADLALCAMLFLRLDACVKMVGCQTSFDVVAG